MFLGFEFIRDLSFYDLYRGHPRTPSGSNKSKKIRMSPRVATRTHVTKITLKYACRTQNGAVRPERASLHIRPFFNVTTRAARIAFSDELARKMTKFSPRKTFHHIFIQTSQNSSETDQS